MKRYFSITVVFAVLLLALATVDVKTSNAQEVSEVRLGIVPDPNPSGALFSGTFADRSWSAIIDGRTGQGRIVVIEVRDVAPVANRTGPGGTNGIDTVQVNIFGDSDERGIRGLVLRETSGTSAVFRGTIRFTEDDTSSATHQGISDPTNPSRPFLQVEERDEVTVEYSGAVSNFIRSDSLVIETDGPEITDFDPRSRLVTREDRIQVLARVVDNDSSVDLSDILFLTSPNQLNDNEFFDGRRTLPFNEILADHPEINTIRPSDSSEIRGGARNRVIGYDVETRVRPQVSGGFGVIYVTIAAFDRAGNVTILNADRDDNAAFAKYTVDTERPRLFQARTGVFYNNRLRRLEGNDRTKIQVIFRDATDLDPSTIRPSDFRVEGHEVVRADWWDRDTVTRDFNGDALTGDDPKRFIRRMVFLTLRDELRSDEVPNVFVVPNGVADEAGNVISSGELRGRDSLGPELSVLSMSSDFAGPDDSIEIVISSGERLGGSGTPTVRVSNVFNPGQRLSVDVRSTGTNRWLATVGRPTATTIYNVFITAQDRQGQITDLGLPAADNLPTNNRDGIIDGFFDNGNDINEDAIYFEADISLPNPKIDPRDGTRVAFRNPLVIVIDFGEVGQGETVHEGNEYRGDSHDSVTLTLAELDGRNVLSRASTSVGQKWVLTIADISTGRHTLRINARDEAGNTLGRILETRFTVEEREPFRLRLNPGWNMISFPGDPANPAIDAVFPPNVPVTTVYSFDPLTPGGWSLAVRDSDDGRTFNPFVGDLRTIDSVHAYWVLSETTVDIQTFIPPFSGTGATAPTVPPVIDIFEGWNLVPVIDVSGSLKARDVIDSDVYFAGIANNAVRILTFDTLTSQWRTVLLDGRRETGTQEQLTRAGVSGACSTCPLDANERLEVGKAYWVFANENGTLVP